MNKLSLLQNKALLPVLYIHRCKQDTVEPLLAATSRSKAKWPLMGGGCNLRALLEVLCAHKNSLPLTGNR